MLYYSLFSLLSKVNKANVQTKSLAQNLGNTKVDSKRTFSDVIPGVPNGDTYAGIGFLSTVLIYM